MNAPKSLCCHLLITVILEILARVLFSRIFADAKFCEIKPMLNGEINLLFATVGKSRPICDFLTWRICLFTLLAKIQFSPKFPNLQYSLKVLE